MNRLFKISFVTFVMALPFLLSTVVTSSFNIANTAYAAPGGGHHGGGQGGGNPGSGGGSKGPKKGDLYGDVLYLDRNVDGVPYWDDYQCLRPIVPGGALLPLVGDGEGPDYDDAGIPADRDFWTCSCPEPDLLMAEAEDSDVEDPCEIQPECACGAWEPELGRVSVLKAPTRIVDRQRDEAIRLIQGATLVTLDPGGRPLADDVPFDSPLINLALFREFLTYGGLYEVDNQGNSEAVWVPPEVMSEDYTPVQGAAFGLGAGSPKDDEEVDGYRVDVEVVARIAKILGMPEYLINPPYPALPDSPLGDTPLEGPVVYVGSGNDEGDELFIDFRSFTGYDRAATYPGRVCYATTDGVTLTWHNMLITAASVTEPGAVFTWPSAANYTKNNISGFAQAAEDARRVITFYHDPADIVGPSAVLVDWMDSAFDASEETRSCPET